MDQIFINALDSLKRSYKITIGFHGIKFAILVIFMILDYSVLDAKTGTLSTWMLIAISLTFANICLYGAFFFMSLNNK